MGLTVSRILGEQKNRGYGEEWSKNCDVVLNFCCGYISVISMHTLFFFFFNNLNKDVLSKQVQSEYS